MYAVQVYAYFPSLETVYRPFEQNVYPLHNSGRFYKFLPSASKNDFLIEKSPSYSRQYKSKFYKDCDKRATLQTASDIMVRMTTVDVVSITITSDNESTG